MLKTIVLDTFANEYAVKLMFFAFWVFGGWGSLEVSNLLVFCDCVCVFLFFVVAAAAVVAVVCVCCRQFPPLVSTNFH